MRTTKHFIAIPIVLFLLSLTLTSCNNQEIHKIQNGDLILEIDGKLNTRIQSKNNPSTPLNSSFQNSEFIGNTEE